MKTGEAGILDFTIHEGWMETFCKPEGFYGQGKKSVKMDICSVREKAVILQEHLQWT